MTKIQTYTGRSFDILHPTPEMVDIRDIAHALSQINRFGGHTKFPYSVAQHSVLVSHLCPERWALVGLMHDAAEAYVGDVVRPLKLILYAHEHSPGFTFRRFPDTSAIDPFKVVEQRIYTAICVSIGLMDVIPTPVDDADQQALSTEFRDLLNNANGANLDRDPGGNVIGWMGETLPEPAAIHLTEWTADTAECQFLNRFNDLRADRNQWGVVLEPQPQPTLTERVRQTNLERIGHCLLCGADPDLCRCGGDGR